LGAAGRGAAFGAIGGGGARVEDARGGGGAPFRGLLPDANALDVNGDGTVVVGNARDRATSDEGRLVGLRARMAAARGSIVKECLVRLSSVHG
jgi:hypothetical protein